MDQDLFLLKRERDIQRNKEIKQKENETIILFKKKYQQIIEKAINESFYLNILIGYFLPSNKLSFLIFKTILKNDLKIFQNIYIEIIKYNTENQKQFIENKVIKMLNDFLK